MSTVSVAIAAYKGEKFIGEQLLSLAAQTRLPDEVIICDDSPDNATEQAVMPFAGRLNIRYFRNTCRLGVNGNFARAVSLAQGEIIFLCDQDDFWHPDKIAKMADALTAHPEADGVFCDSAAVDEQRNALGFSLWQMRNFTAKMQRQLDAGEAFKVFLKRVTLSAHNIAFRKRMLEFILPFPELEPFYPDTWIALRIALLSNWIMVAETLTDYRIHSENLSAPGLSGIAAQTSLARKARDKDFLSRRVKIADALTAGATPEIPAQKAALLAGFRRHYQRRSDYSANFLLRALQICREAASLRYCRYSNGWRSMAADLFLFRKA